MISALLWLLETVVGLIVVLVIVNAVISWLVAFDVVSRRNRLVATIWDFTSRLTEPLLAPIRRILPPIGGIDLSPLVLILGLQFLLILIRNLVFGAL